MRFDATCEARNTTDLPFGACSFAVRVSEIFQALCDGVPTDEMIAACHDLGDFEEVRIGVLRRAHHMQAPEGFIQIVYGQLFIEQRGPAIAKRWSGHSDSELEASAASNRSARAAALDFGPPGVKIFAKNPDFLPSRQSAGAAGMDLKAYIPDSEHTKKHAGQPPIPCIRLEKDQTVAIPNGFAIAVPPGYEMQIRPRSGLSLKGRILVILGTLDSDYRGPVKTIVRALSHNVCIEHGERISQAIISPILTPKIIPVASAEDLGETERGAGGFGSTGRT